MPQPTASDVHVNRPLTNVMIAWSLRPGAFAFNTVFPMVPVMKQSDKYFVWDRKDAHRDQAAERGPGGKAPVTVRRLSTDQYQCTVYSIAEAIDDQVRANQDAPLNLDRSASRNVGDKIMLRFERKWATNFFVTGVWTGSTTGTDLVGGVDFTQFAAPATGSPTTVIREQIFHLAKLNVRPEEMTLTLGPDVFRVFLDHDDFLNRLSDNEPQILNQQRIATILGIRQVVVPMLGFNPDNETEPGAFSSPNTNEFVFNDSMLLSWAPTAPSITDPSAGYTFWWRGLTGGNNGMRILRYRDEPHTDMIEGEGTLDPKATAPELGVFFSDCLA